MKARELIQRYRQGERDFRGVDLQGESLRGLTLQDIDLSGANLSKTDLRSTRLERAQLVGADFSHARTGTRRWWIGLVLIASLALSIAAYFLVGEFFANFSIAIVEPSARPVMGVNEESRYTGKITAGILGLGTTGFILWTYYRKGLIAAWYATAVAVAGSAALSAASFLYFFIAIAAGLGYGGTETMEATFGVSDTLSSVADGILRAAAAATVGLAAAAAVAIAAALADSAAIVTATAASISAFAAVASNITDVENPAPIVITAVISTLLTAGLIYLAARRAINGDHRDRLVRNLAVWLSSLGGTSFCHADLSGATFAHATVKAAHFKGANLHRTCFHLAKQLHLSRAYNTALNNRPVLDLLVSLRPAKNAFYAGLNLKGAYLSRADLSDLNLTAADLSGADLTGTDLQRASLTKVQALGTCFNQANLTAACIEDWSIDDSTELDGAICDHVYLQPHQQKRCPATGSFAPGEFARLLENAFPPLT